MNEEQPSRSPWMKNLMIWGGIALVLALLVSVFNPRTDAAATQISYSDFRAKVQAGQVASVQVGETKILGKYKDDKPFTTVPIPNDTTLQALLQDSGTRYDGKPPEESDQVEHPLGARVAAGDDEHPLRRVDSDHPDAGLRNRDGDAAGADGELDDGAARRERLVHVELDVLGNATAPRVVDARDRVVDTHPGFRATHTNSRLSSVNGSCSKPP